MRSSKPRTFPFLPKSNALLMPGDFWGIQIAPNKFAAGRIVELPWQHSGMTDRRMFLAGLMDWCGEASPTSHNIANRKVLEEGFMHVRAFSFSNWRIEGHRELALDGIEPLLVRTAACHNWVQRGFSEERVGTTEELSNCPQRVTWGMKVIEIVAQMRFGVD